MRAGGRGRGSGARGAAAVEFAIVLPVLLLVVLGAIDWGYYFFCREVVVNASREGARAGSVIPPGSDPRPDAQAAAENYLTRGALDVARATVTASEGTASVIVVIQYRTGSITGFLASVMPSSVVARAEMRR
ncbi:TadE/TadG family type IV pilus assembly protein [Anaeromyxobacter oryzisoli]|uniref:TadE/TadG family type IV pilus assembly protein n=1 Tax=Anaeromyxobacter oryzisoli TaxID=2925408 RepID=UPI001F5985E0|nr:TadE/TadG family type IV pilus assembly protein [Anaeromyxobacter sp. SG63]